MQKKNPVRVAQIMGFMGSGGVEMVVTNYYRFMDKTMVRFDFFVDENSPFPQRQQLENLGATVYLLPPYTKQAAYQRTLTQKLKEENYDIVHAHINTMNVFPLFAAQRANIPVRICHNHSMGHWGEGGKTLLKYLLRPYARLFATHYFACGEYSGRWMYGDRNFDAGRVYVMPNAIDTEKFTFNPAARTALRQELHLPQDAFVVGHVGRFMYQKNHEFLVGLFAALLQTVPDAYLLLIGEGELAEKIKQQVTQAGLSNRVVFAGVRTDTARLYSAMDVFCLPSFYEGLPVVAIEAQANGLPCLFSNKVTPESVLLPGTQTLPLKKEAWAFALASLKETQRAHPQAPGDKSTMAQWDIRHCAEELCRWYLQRRLPDGNSKGDFL